MIIDGVKKRKSGTITINYTEDGKLYGLTLTPQEIVELYKSRPTKRAADGSSDPSYIEREGPAFNPYKGEPK